MFAIKLTKENRSKILERIVDWKPEVLDELLNDPLDIEDGIVRYVIPDFDFRSDLRASVAIIASKLEADFNYDPSETDWFEITRK